MRVARIAGIVAAATVAAVGGAGAAGQETYDQLATEVLRELIEIRTSAAYPDNTKRLLEGVAARLASEGFTADDMTLVEAGGTNLVVRYRGSGARRPLLAMAHVDVVDADPDSWQVEPFVFAESDGYYYGRGTTDNKTGATSLIVNFIRLRREGYVPDRDLIMVLTGNEETTMAGIADLAQQRRELIDAELALNSDSGGGVVDANGEPSSFAIQMAEKRYQTFELITSNPGGHSSLPRPDNAIYELAHALVRLQQHRFPIRISEIARESFRVIGERMPGEAGELLSAAGEENGDPDAVRRLAAADPWANSTMRTTCVATMLRGGHAENALPQSATATVNCRIFPGTEVPSVQATLERVAAMPGLRVQVLGAPQASPASPLREDVVEAVTAAVHVGYPGTPVIPYMAPYGTDGRPVRAGGIPTYGVMGLFIKDSDQFAHGLNERVSVRSFYNGLEHWYTMLTRLAGHPAS